MIDSASCTKAVSDIYLPRSLILEAKHKGYKISVVPNVSDESYFRAYCISRNETFSTAARQNMKDKLLNNDAAVDNCRKMVIELVDIENIMAAHLSFELYDEELSIEYLSVKEACQLNGLGTLLMRSVVEVAVLNNIPNIALVSEYNTISFYNKFGFKEVKPGNSIPFMILAAPERSYIKSKALEYYDLAYSDAQLLLPIPYKNI